MIAKIISGGQTGVDRAALDAAIRLGIPHGGWIPKGRLTEDGPLPASYALVETASAVYAERTEKNVIDADGTLIISRGALSGGSEVTREMAVKHGRPWLHVDLERMSAFHAALEIRRWIDENRVAILNVAGPRASKDPSIYTSALALIEAVGYLSLTASGPGPPADVGAGGSGTAAAAESVKEALDQLIQELPLKDRTTLANMSAAELPGLMPTLGEFIIHRFLAGANPALMNSCRWVAHRAVASDTDAAGVIIRELWKRLKRTHTLRRIK
ncbi:MAG: putative molybdenum carrier protein [Desulfobacterales bacterium]|nr:putative molybdenum carrier protein [Desulfobacterales bacterium]